MGCLTIIEGGDTTGTTVEGKMIKNRLWPLALLSIAVMAMVILSAGLARLELSPGQLYSEAV